MRQLKTQANFTIVDTQTDNEHKHSLSENNT